VDDEESIRIMTGKTLEQHGYQVLVASEGSEAVTLFAQHRAQIGAVLTDLMMPLMDGTILIRTLNKMAPGVKVMATTGAMDAAQLAAVRRLGVKIILRKPYSTQVLLHQIRALLDGHEDPKSVGSATPF